NFPTTPGAYDTSYNGGASFGDVFVLRLNAAGSGLIYSTFIGGSSDDEGEDLAFDTLGCLYVTGLTYSPDYPLANAFDSSQNGGSDGMVTKFALVPRAANQLFLENGVEWYVTADTMAFAVTAGDVDNDGKAEIVTGGQEAAPLGESAQLKIWRWECSSLVVEKDYAWSAGGHGNVNAVAA